MSVQSWGEVFTQSLQGVWFSIASIIPGIVIALLILIIGWVFAILVERLVIAIFRAVKVDNALKTAGVEDVVRHAGYNLNSGRFVGGLVKWFIIVVFLIASLDVLGLSQVNEFLRDVVSYLPRVIVAVLILMVAAVVAEVMRKVVVGSSRAANIGYSNFLGSITKWAIWVFAILTAIFHLGIAPELVQTIFMGLIAALAIACGLAFGLGGKNAAEEVIAKVRHSVVDHH